MNIHEYPINIVQISHHYPIYMAIATITTITADITMAKCHRPSPRASRMRSQGFLVDSSCGPDGADGHGMKSMELRHVAISKASPVAVLGRSREIA